MTTELSENNFFSKQLQVSYENKNFNLKNLKKSEFFNS